MNEVAYNWLFLATVLLAVAACYVSYSMGRYQGRNIDRQRCATCRKDVAPLDEGSFEDNYRRQ